MRRSAHTILAGLSLLLLAGCSSGMGEPAWTAQRWEQAKACDQQRLAGWDAKQPTGVWGAIVYMWNTPGRLVGYYSGETPLAAAQDLFDASDPDRRLAGLIYLSKRDWGREGNYLSVYGHMAASDPDELVRAMAVRVLNRSRDHGAVPVLLGALEDKSTLVRVEAGKALANIPDERAVAPLQKHLGDATEDRDVRIACADALREYKALAVAQTLIRQLRDREFAVAWQARRSLRFMLGKDFEYDQAGWLGYLTGAQRPLG
jgi:hypothetical protein